MKSFLYLALCIGSLCVVSCETQAEANAATASSFGSPETVGALPDGRSIQHVVVTIPNEHNHHIYFVGDSISINRTVSQGKTTRNQVTVLIDGVEYEATKVEK